MAACCPSSSSSSSIASAENNPAEAAMQLRLDQMRRERQSELKHIGRLVANAAATAQPGAEPQAAVRRLLSGQQRDQDAPQAQGQQPEPGPSTADILVEVRGLSELRPVSRILQSSAFRTELESLVRYSLSPRQARPQPQPQGQQPQEQPQQRREDSPSESLTELRRRRHEDLVQEISELLHSQLVTGGFNGAFRSHLERELRGRAEVLPDGGQRTVEALRRLPPSGIQRNDFSHLGIYAGGAAGADDFNSASSIAGDDVLSVVSVPIAGAAAAAVTAASSAAVSRQLHSVQRELTDLRRTVRLLLGNQLETQRMIRQEVSAALAGRAAPPAPQATAATGPPGACLICLSGRADTVMYRCGHLCLCSMCTARMRESAPDGRMACPVCRAPVVDTLRVFSAGVAPDDEARN